MGDEMTVTLRHAPLVDARPMLEDGDALARHVDELGYLYAPGLVPRELVATVRRLVRRYAAEEGLAAVDPGDDEAIVAVPGARFEGSGYEDPRWLKLQQDLFPHPEFRALGEVPALLALLERVCGEPVMAGRGDICRLVMPQMAVQTTRPHQDHFYVGGSTAIWTAWMPLVDCPLALGPLAVLPGSHRDGFRHHGEGYAGTDVAADAVWAAGDVGCGDVILFHCLTVHRAWPNTSDRLIRASADFRYQPRSHPIHTGHVPVGERELQKR